MAMNMFKISSTMLASVGAKEIDERKCFSYVLLTHFGRTLKEKLGDSGIMR